MNEKQLFEFITFDLEFIAYVAAPDFQTALNLLFAQCPVFTANAYVNYIDGLMLNGRTHSEYVQASRGSTSKDQDCFFAIGIDDDDLPEWLIKLANENEYISHDPLPDFTPLFRTPLPDVWNDDSVWNDDNIAENTDSDDLNWLLGNIDDNDNFADFIAK